MVVGPKRGGIMARGIPRVNSGSQRVPDYDKKASGAPRGGHLGSRTAALGSERAIQKGCRAPGTAFVAATLPGSSDPRPRRHAVGLRAESRVASRSRRGGRNRDLLCELLSGRRAAALDGFGGLRRVI